MAATEAPSNGGRPGLSLRALHLDERGEDGTLTGLMVGKADEAATRAVVQVGDVLLALRIGQTEPEQIRARMLAIARGEIKPKPTPVDSLIWITSMRSLARQCAHA